ncbi:phosphoribosylanthranilate isomerase [Aneurinibacillus tyrosinisolvens]|uniref:phosphoribosylanthranilate isomerase n=1 Tax=Aneurinibacillus tyrosinisolvens TaxID=1443435 RepID=UPI00063F4887|nr:phosphoribosylanthranilate isomerase [Aneurinibacillus tyrosinisolvens]
MNRESRLIIKVCGITETDTLGQIAEEQLAIDWLGFVFAQSRRRVSAKQWEELAAFVPVSYKAAGVFVNPLIQEIEEVFSCAPLDIVQLHGEESPAFCRKVKETFSVPIIKAIGIERSADNWEEMDNYTGAIDYLLLDTMTSSQSGGTGETFNWNVIPYYKEWCARHGIPLLVAGGIRADNARSLLTDYAPDGLDVSSSVETEGRKDADKIREFVGRMRQYEQHGVK